MPDTDLLRLLFDLERRLQAAQQEIETLRAVVQGAICKQCGKLSWDVPLDDYCQCEPRISERSHA